MLVTVTIHPGCQVKAVLQALFSPGQPNLFGGHFQGQPKQLVCLGAHVRNQWLHFLEVTSKKSGRSQEKVRNQEPGIKKGLCGCWAPWWQSSGRCRGMTAGKRRTHWGSKHYLALIISERNLFWAKYEVFSFPLCLPLDACQLFEVGALEFEKVHLPPPVKCHTSHVICHVSHDTCYKSHVLCQISHVFFKLIVQASWWRVCYLVFIPFLGSHFCPHCMTWAH